MPASDEKRAHPRVEARIPLRCKELYGDSYLDQCTHTKNLSEGGTNFECGHFIKLARRLLIDLNLPSILKPVRGVIKVVWVRKLAKEETYEIGSQFLDMRDEDRKVLSNYINEILASES